MVLNNLYQCGVCASSCLAIIPLLDLHQVLIETLYNVLKIYINPHGFPKYACESCIDKIETFDNLISELLKGQEHFYAFEENMLHDLDNTGKRSSTVEEHSINCQCEMCSENCGLQLLADVIEQKESEQVEENVAGHPAIIPMVAESTSNQPSTSSAGTGQHKTKQMKCTFCDKTFSHKGDMNKHLRTHTGEQPFSCYICQRKFKHTSNLKRHLAVHSGNKPFQCNLCGKKFNRKDKMESHRKTKLCKKVSSHQT